jgi:hypothetical protein
MAVQRFALPDPYQNQPKARLVERIRELSSALMTWQLIAANMGTVPGALDSLTPESRQMVERVMDAYSD